MQSSTIHQDDQQQNTITHEEGCIFPVSVILSHLRLKGLHNFEMCSTLFDEKNQPIFENPINIETDCGMIVAFSTFMERPIMIRQVMIYMHGISTH